MVISTEKAVIRMTVVSLCLEFVCLFTVWLPKFVGNKRITSLVWKRSKLVCLHTVYLQRHYIPNIKAFYRFYKINSSKINPTMGFNQKRCFSASERMQTKLWSAISLFTILRESAVQIFCKPEYGSVPSSVHIWPYSKFTLKWTDLMKLTRTTKST